GVNKEPQSPLALSRSPSPQQQRRDPRNQRTEHSSRRPSPSCPLPCNAWLLPAPLHRDRPEELACRKPHQAKDRKSTRLNSSHVKISYAVFCLKKKKQKHQISMV